MTDFSTVGRMLPDWQKKMKLIKNTGVDKMSGQEALQWLQAYKDQEDKLRGAFYTDTKEFNTLENCMRMSPDWIIQMVTGRVK